MNNWVQQYLGLHKAALDSIPVTAVAELIEQFQRAWADKKQIFVCGNGGSAANASHFVTDLGKGASDKLGGCFHCLSLNDNVSWMTAIANDYKFEDIFLRQLTNYARPGDVFMAMSVSGNSPNVVAAMRWAGEQKLQTIALVGKRRGQLASLAERVITIDSEHYGRVEDAHMTICHMVCYAFMENPERVRK